MSKNDFIALADTIRAHNRNCSLDEMFTKLQIAALAEFCREQNSDFKRDRWLQYINGKCGQNGGAIRRKA
jgi:hypothetical protein